MASTEELSNELLAHYEPGIKETPSTTLVYRPECHDDACGFKGAWSFTREFAEAEGAQHLLNNDNGMGEVVHVISVHWSQR